MRGQTRWKRKAHSTYIYISGVEILDLNYSHFILDDPCSAEQLGHTIARLLKQNLITQEGEVPIWEETHSEQHCLEGSDQARHKLALIQGAKPDSIPN